MILNSKHHLYFSINKLITLFLSNFYLLNINIYLIALFITAVRPGVFMIFVYIIIFALLLQKKRFLKLNSTDVLVIFYSIYNLISFLWCNLSGFTIINFLEEVTTSIFPVLLYFSARYIVKFEDKYYKNTLISIFICMIIGIVLYISMPSFYRDFLYRYGFSYSDLVVHCRQGMSSYIGRIAAGTITVYGLFISSKFYLKFNDKKYLFIFIFLCISCLLTAQRSAWFGLIIALLYLIINVLVKKGRLDIFVYILVFISISLILANNFNLFDGNQILTKSLNLSNMFQDREYTWIPALRNINNILIGNGLGTSGHRALGINQFFVTDGYYIKLISEIGIIGLIAFITVVINALFVGIKKWKNNDISILLIIFILGQCIGSNILAIQIISPMFWLAIGLCTSSRKIRRS